MKTKLLPTVLLFIFGLNGYGQDLVPYSGTIINTSLYTNDLFDIRFQIKNNSSYTTAPQNYIGIRISQYNNNSNSNSTGVISLGYVSVETLAPGQISNTIQYKLPLPYTIASGTWYVYIVADNFNNILESNENNNWGLFQGSISVTKHWYFHTRQNLPHPILFVHGWVGDNTAWGSFKDSVLNRQYGWSDGGVLDYCLNYDNDVTTGGLFTDFHNYIDPMWVKIGDVYRINFDIDYTGDWLSYEGSKNNNPSQSNQSAIIKQGYAIGQAINYILNLTGKDKVILVGHSMGGLACREYVQFWNSQDKVAKLVTIGTPNSGSNSTAWGFGSWGVNNLDEQSEAVRDMRISYKDSGKDGVYLYGGWETNGWISNSPFWSYHNVDVNCNGVEGEYYPYGLNYENYKDINYSCVIGKGDDCAAFGTSFYGDGVVEGSSANLYNAFLNTAPSYIDTFISWSPVDYFCPNNLFHTKIHQYQPDAPSNYYSIYSGENLMRALDEPDYFDAVGYGHAYDVSFNKLYYGTISKKNQDPINSNGIDYDDYKFVVTAPSTLIFNIYNVNIHNLEVQIYSSNQTAYSSPMSNNGKGNISFSLPNVPAGTYYLEIRGIVNSNPLTWYRSYGFEIFKPISPTIIEEEPVFTFDINVFPNPSKGQFYVDIFSNPEEKFNIDIINSIGQVVYSEKGISTGKQKINLQNITNGIYSVIIFGRDKVINKNILITK